MIPTVEMSHTTTLKPNDYTCHLRRCGSCTGLSQSRRCHGGIIFAAKGRGHGSARPQRRLGMACGSEVTAEQFKVLVEGRTLDGEQLTARIKNNRRAGYDMTFSPPKGVSIAALLIDPKIADAFEDAVTTTLTEIEKASATRVRRGGASSDRVTGNLAIARFTHTTTRPGEDGKPDPQLHQPLLCGATSPTTRWKNVIRHCKTRRCSWTDLISRQSSATIWPSVFKTLVIGLERKPRAGTSDLPKELTNKFSRRTSEIERLARREGNHRPRAKRRYSAAAHGGAKAIS